MKKQFGISSIDVAMSMVVFMLLATVALPVINNDASLQVENLSDSSVSIIKVHQAFAYAIALRGDFPKLSEVVDNIDADFATETNDYTGIIFRDSNERMIVRTYNDHACRVFTSKQQMGVSDIVRCVQL